MISIFFPLVALLGFVNAAYLLLKKLGKKKLVCFIGGDCDRVVKSKYGYVGNIPNEVFGIAYYFFVIGVFFWLGLGGSQEILGFSAKFLLFMASLLAAGASAYLVFVQARKLKEWCEYCLLSAGINFALFFVAFFMV